MHDIKKSEPFPVRLNVLRIKCCQKLEVYELLNVFAQLFASL
jgi:hypothetical protein